MNAKENADQPRLPAETIAHYGSGYEWERLADGTSRLELVRSQVLLSRFLPPAPATVLDIGGGPGAYAAWLAREGYQVHLLDAVPLHVTQAREASAQQPDHPFTAAVGDARALPYGDESADAALLFGPLYHLTERGDRLQALAEARRVLRPGGVVLAAAISRYASLIDGLKRGYLADPGFVRIVERALDDGQHRNPQDHPGYFTTAYFHHPDELAQEIVAAGLSLDAVLAVEGPGSLLPDLSPWWDDPQRRDLLLAFIARVEAEPSLLGMGGHLMAVGRRPIGSTANDRSRSRTAATLDE
ncbi:MAG: class I SAM-dependent methyltransferase [Thermomicrobiales bacterium]